MAATKRLTHGKRRRSIAGLTAWLAVSALVVGACSSGGNNAAEGETSSTGGAAVGTETSSAGGTQTGGSKDRMVVALDTNVNIIEPHTFRTTSAYAVTRGLYGPLLDQKFESKDNGVLLLGTNEVVGDLAESYTMSPDGTEATFKIKPNAKFANGDPVTAKDFAYTMKRAIEGPGYIGALLPFINVSSSDQIEVVDDHTLKIHLSAPSPLFDRFMTFQVFGGIDQAVVDKNATKDDPWGMDYLGKSPTASGPYQLTQFDTERQVVLDPNPGYPGADQLGNSGVTVRFVPDADQRALLVKRGDLDLVSGMPPRLLKELDADPNVNVVRTDSSRLVYMGMNNTLAPLDNKLVRQAISYAVPYDAIMNQVMFGYAKPAGNLVTSPMDTYAGDEIGTYSENLDKAKQLMDQAGVGNVNLELAVRQSRAEDQQAAVFIQDNLAKIGINVTINKLPDGEFSTRLNNKELPLFIHDWYSWGEDPFYQMQFLVQSEAFTNFTQFKSPKLDQLIKEGTFETDPAKRADISKQAQQILFDEAPMVYLYAPDFAVAVHKGVCGVAVDYTKVIRFDKLTHCSS